MEKDEELERIRRRKLREMVKERITGDEERIVPGEVLNEPIEITDVSFAKTIRNHPLLVVDCWAAWCGPCHMIAPTIEKMAQDYAGKIVFGKLNVDENQKTALEFNIMSIPTLLVFKYGKLVDRIVGAMPRQVLEPKITRYL